MVVVGEPWSNVATWRLNLLYKLTSQFEAYGQVLKISFAFARNLGIFVNFHRENAKFGLCDKFKFSCDDEVFFDFLT